jgi:hypothetical protein
MAKAAPPEGRLGLLRRAARRFNGLGSAKALNQLQELTQATRELTRSVETLRTRTEQLAAIEQIDWDRREQVAALPPTLDIESVRRHVIAAIDKARLETEPFPHLVVDKWLPTDIYKLMMDGLPPPLFFADRDVSRQRLSVPFKLVPRYSRLVWQLITRDIISQIAGPALNEKFRDVVRSYVKGFSPNLPDDVEIGMYASNGHIMLRRPGYVINPHRDPKWGFVICLVYLARPGDNEAFGTQLYRVKDDQEAPSSTPYYVEPARCELVKSVPFRANTLLVFLNSSGAHGASIPADAEPKTLERYLYQFRLGIENDIKKAVLDGMPPEGRARWQGGDDPESRSFY